MKENNRKKGIGGIHNTIMTVLIIVFFVGIIIGYYAMLYSETRDNIIKSGELNAVSSSERIDKYLITGIDTMKFVSYTMDNMIRDGRSKTEMIDYLENQSKAVVNVFPGSDNGFYAYVNDEYLDSSGWVPDEDYVPSERPWYIDAVANGGRVTVVDPYVDAMTGTMMITLAKTLCDARSVIALDVSMETLQNITEEVASHDDACIEMILDHRYNVIAHSVKSEVGKDYLGETGTLGSAVAGRLSETNESFFSIRHGGIEYIVYAVPVENDWICLSVIDATSTFDRLKPPLILTRAAAVIIVTILLVIMIRSFRKGALAEMLNEQTERAKAESAAKSAFLSNMSHEIRTPINAILGMNEMILRESSDEDILEYAANVRAAGNTLLGIVNDILDFSKIEAGKMEIIPVDYDLSSMLSDLVHMIHTRAEEKGLLVKTEFNADIPKSLHGDEVRLKQVITNILTNAVKYTEKGSVTFGVTYEKTEDTSDTIDMKVWVSDTGIGIKQEDMHKLFGEFQRIEEERNRNIEGAGLGMSITRSLLEMMDSSLTVESEYGKGSTFSFTIRQGVVKWDPLGDYETSYRALIGGYEKYREKFTAPDAAVLVTDDMPMNLTVFKSLLKLTGIRIDTAISGDSAIELARKNKYDIIFLDHMMPEKDGIETLHEMEEDKESPNLNTIKVCLTANAVTGAREEYLAAGFDDYLTKPVDPGRLEEMLLEYLPEEKIHAPVHDLETADDELFGETHTLPDFVEYISEISTDAGLTNCGSVEGYVSALETYAGMIGKHADETENFWRAGDLANATIKIHALKSTSRIIGAIAIGDLAQKLENAGKAGDAETVGAGIEELLGRCRKLGEQLSPLCSGNGAVGDDENLPPISAEELQEAYELINEANSMFRLDDVNEIAESLKGYRIPDEEKERVAAIIKAVDELDYDRLTEII